MGKEIVECPKCKGRGKLLGAVFDSTCPKCHGTGHIEVWKK